MAQLSFKRYATNTEFEAEKQTFKQGDLVFNKEKNTIYVVINKSDTSVTLEPYYGGDAFKEVSGSDTNTLTFTKESGDTSSVTVNNVAKAVSADSATKDSAGNTISTTYVKKMTGAVPVAYRVSSLLNQSGIKIDLPCTWNPQQAVMFAFTVRIYNGYKYTDIVISGYNYGSNHWHLPTAEIIGGTQRYTIKFGWNTDPKTLFIWIGRIDTSYSFSYGGLSIFNVHSGHDDADMSTGWAHTFCSATELEALSTLGGIQATQTPVLNTKADGTNASGTWGISISGNAKTATTATSATSATKATNDGSGNNIVNTYQQKVEIIDLT